MSGAGYPNWRDCRRAIHRPWSANPLELAEGGVELGKTYPEPIVEHNAGRERALKAYAMVRAASL
jgi:deoxyribodipyrimidine photo-lyase